MSILTEGTQQVSIIKKKKETGTSPVVQWLRLHSPNAAGTGLIPGQRRSRMPGAAKKKKKKRKKKRITPKHNPERMLNYKPKEKSYKPIVRNKDRNKRNKVDNTTLKPCL